MSKLDLFEKLPIEKQEIILNAGLTEFSTKPYAEANTDNITSACGISKGLLFYYFGSKKNFYLYCLSHSLNQLTAFVPEPTGTDFYDILFSSMDAKVQLCLTYPLQTKLINMASRECAKDIMAQKNALILEYTLKVKKHSSKLLAAALSTLQLKEPNNPYVIDGLSLYISSVINRYLLIYQEKPEAFFNQAEAIKEELHCYIDLMLNGILKE